MTFTRDFIVSTSMPFKINDVIKFEILTAPSIGLIKSMGYVSTLFYLVVDVDLDACFAGVDGDQFVIESKGLSRRVLPARRTSYP